MNTFPKNLSRLRKAAGLKQEELAEKLNVTRQTISGWETGRRQPDLDMLKQIADALNADIGDLIYGVRMKYPRFQKKYVIWAVLCGCIALAVAIDWFFFFEGRILYGSPSYHPDAAMWGRFFRQIGWFAGGMLLPAVVALYVSVQVRKRLPFLLAGITCGVITLMLPLSLMRIIDGIIAFGVLFVWASAFGQALFQQILPFLSGLLIFFGTNKE